jgi:hypothetical protein
MQENKVKLLTITALLSTLYRVHMVFNNKKMVDMAIYGVICHKKGVFVTTAVKTSIPI